MLHCMLATWLLGLHQEAQSGCNTPDHICLLRKIFTALLISKLTVNWLSAGTYQLGINGGDEPFPQNAVADIGMSAAGELLQT